SGESFVRQSLYGLNYFCDKFGVRPYTINNFDPFGHTQGLAQILNKAGYKYYMFCRPDLNELQLPHVFKWKGFDGSHIIASRSPSWYCTPLGKAAESAESFIANNKTEEINYLLWGVGDHGGGPSKKDLEDISALIEKYAGNITVCHSSPDEFFGDYINSGAQIPEIDRDINSVFVGCYTSQALIKQLHRKLENELLSAEKMASAAAVNGLAEYPEQDIKNAWLDLLYLEFHDILPGTSIQAVEDACIRGFHRPLELLSRIKTRAFFSLASGQKQAVDGEIPILVYNPHPFKLAGTYECEFSLADFNWNEEEFSDVEVYRNGVKIPAQVEKEAGNLMLDWRKRVVFNAELEPSCMNRFDCRVVLLPEKPAPGCAVKNGVVSFENKEMSVKINAETGYIDSYKVNGRELAGTGFGEIAVYADTADPWKSDGCYIENYEGSFVLMNETEAAEFSGVPAENLAPVRIIEDGAARMCVEALLKYKHSFARVLYMLPKSGTDFYAEYKIYCGEKDKHIRLNMPTVFSNFTAQTAYGEYAVRTDGKEQAAQRWFMGEDGENALAVINRGTYGVSVKDGLMRQSLLRTSAYAALTIGERPLVPSDRFMPRIDQGERSFSFMFCGGGKISVEQNLDAASLAYNESPMVLSFFPSGKDKGNGDGGNMDGGIKIDNARMDAFKKAENGGGYVLRLFNVKNIPVTARVTYKDLSIDSEVALGAFEIKTYAVEYGILEEIPMLERDFAYT
ncbi:MAG: alpha-mannosidase, partial [Oscillospiraceae bacterium]|nr:alpha-mannosidase [Oscillospiraceae bacterium]